jgi:hypothetical protein
MANPHKPSVAPRPPTFDETYFPGDPIPVAEATEKDSDTTWALWADLVANENIGFADTVPTTAPQAVPVAQPAAHVTRPKAKPVSHAGTTLDEVLLEARRNNRICPQPAKWEQLYQMLAVKPQQGSGRKLNPPPVGTAWLETPPLAKRMFFRDHVEWAAAHECVGDVFSFLRRLPEQHWYHMGE